jgi:hypothetical protein
VGQIEAFHFDNDIRAITHLLVSTGSWCGHRRVRIPTAAIETGWTADGLSAGLTREEIANLAEDGAALGPAATIIGYHLEAMDGGIGHVDDFLFDEGWAVWYFVVDTSNFIGGKSVVISPLALDSIDRVDHKLHLALTRHQVELSPPFDSVDVAPGEGPRVWIM